MLRVSVSALDNYRYFVENEMKTTTEYVSELCRLAPRTDEMARGEDFHLLMQTGESELYYWQVEVDAMLLKPDLFEHPCRQMFKIGGEDVLLSGRIDAAHGDTIIDYKTTSSTLNLEQYADHMQWKAYLTLMSYMKKFRYEVFHIKQEKNNAKSFIVNEHKTLCLSAYDGMREQVIQALHEYVEFLHSLIAGQWIEINERGYAEAGVRYFGEAGWVSSHTAN